MYKLSSKPKRSGIGRVEILEGETIEQKIERMVENKEPIKDGAPEIFTERKQGVLSAYNIRTDRFEIACDAMDKIQKSRTAKRDGVGKVVNINKDEESKEKKDLNPSEKGKGEA